MPTTLRIALLAGLLALLSNLAVIGFIYYRTHDEAVATVRRQVVEQAKCSPTSTARGGRPALEDAIEDTMTYADPQAVVALLDANSRQTEGISRRCRDLLPLREGYHNALIRQHGQTTPREAALAVQHLPAGEWLVSGRIAARATPFARRWNARS